MAGRTAIGSADDNDITLKLTTVSRRHAIIRRRFGRFRIEDSHSTNGVFLNGRRIARPMRLRPGDQLRLGDARFVFLGPDAVRANRQALSFRTTLEILILLVAIGFAAATYYSSRGGNWRWPILGAHSSRMMHASVESSRMRAAAVTEKGSGIGGSGPAWLVRLNHYRTITGLAPVGENPALNAGDLAHAKYLVENDAANIRNGTSLGFTMHDETASAPGYSAAGLSAAKASDVIEGFAPKEPNLFAGSKAIDVWIAGPFHRLP
ncbi:MAG: FHA domain-containing protein, partial [Candidatus Binataceae bacterium]